MTRVEDDDMVETLAADGADEPLDIGRLPGRAGSDAHLLDAEAAYTGPEPLAVDGVAISKEISGRGVEGEGFHHLLCGPVGRGMFGDVEVDNLAAFVSQHEEHVENAKGDCRHGEEVDGHKLFRMIVQEGPPGL